MIKTRPPKIAFLSRLQILPRITLQNLQWKYVNLKATQSPAVAVAGHMLDILVQTT